MRASLPLLVLLIGGSIFTACSKKADTDPTASSGTPASTEAAATSAASAPTPTPPPTPAEDSGISFSLSGGNASTGSGNTPSSGGGTTPGAGSAGATPAYEPAQMVNRIYPFYPLSLRMQGVEGRVDLRLRINATGQLEHAEVFKTTEPRFSEFALAAIRTAKFAPARENGKPVPSEGIVPIPFVSELGRGGLSPDSPLARIAYLDGLYYMKDATGKMIPADTKEPFRLSIITPFPENAKPGETLKARVKVAINEEGQVKSVSVSEASTPEFGAALKEIALFWQFIPRLKAGKPVASPAVEFPLTFKVPDQM
jgi:TonB family protein